MTLVSSAYATPEQSVWMPACITWECTTSHASVLSSRPTASFVDTDASVRTQVAHLFTSPLRKFALLAFAFIVSCYTLFHFPTTFETNAVIALKVTLAATEACTVTKLQARSPGIPSASDELLSWVLSEHAHTQRTCIMHELRSGFAARSLV